MKLAKYCDGLKDLADCFEKGQSMYSHSAACKGRLVRLQIIEVSVLGTSYTTEYGSSTALVPAGYQNEYGGFEFIDFITAQALVQNFLELERNKLLAQVSDVEQAMSKNLAGKPAKGDYLPNGFNTEVTIRASSWNVDREFDQFYRTRVAHPDFVPPKVGDKVTALVNYNTGASTGDIVIRAGSMGTFMNINSGDDAGYHGCVIYFEGIKQWYPAGVVVPLNDIHYFKFTSE